VEQSGAQFRREAAVENSYRSSERLLLGWPAVHLWALGCRNLRYCNSSPSLCPMSTSGLAIFVFLAFLVPIPLLSWLDKPRESEKVQVE
jgi:hypothetical protein